MSLSATVAILWVRGAGKEATTMAAATLDLFRRPQTHLYRRICAWCSTDLGALTYHSDYHSYGICVDCVQQFYPDLCITAEHETMQPMLRERAVGAD